MKRIDLNTRVLVPLSCSRWAYFAERGKVRKTMTGPNDTGEKSEYSRESKRVTRIVRENIEAAIYQGYDVQVNDAPGTLSKVHAWMRRGPFASIDGYVGYDPETGEQLDVVITDFYYTFRNYKDEPASSEQLLDFIETFGMSDVTVEKRLDSQVRLRVKFH